MAKSLLATLNLPKRIINIFTHSINSFKIQKKKKKLGPFHVDRTIIETFLFLIFITSREKKIPENTNKHILDTIILAQTAAEFDNKI